MWIEKTPLSGCFIVRADPFIDHRGIFARFFCEKELDVILEGKHIVNINFSRTKQAGSIRGMHYQTFPYAEMKFVRCMKGKIFDVAVDIRADSPTFLRWYGIELSAENMDMLFVPEGFAHGFQTLSDEAEVVYFVTEHYSKGNEGALHYCDPLIDINWPCAISDVSEKDAQHTFIDKTFRGIALKKH